MARNTAASPHRLSVLRSSSFRIIAMFAGCFVLSGMTVMALSGYRSFSLLSQQMRHAVANERDEALSDANIPDVAHLQPVVHELVQHEPGFYYLLQDAGQHVVVGNMLHLRPVAGWRTLSWTHRSLPPDRRPVIGYGVALQDGGYLFVGIDAEPVQTLRHDLWFMLAWSAVGFVIIGVGGGWLLSRLVLGKIETISETARDIMRGDMSRRLPLKAGNDEFDHLASSLNAMLERNENLIASISQVTDDIAHDMRRPLAHLGQQLDDLEQSDLSPRQEDILVRAKENLQDALEIFSSLLKLAQIEADDRVPDVQTLDVSDLLITLAELYRPVFEDKEQKFTLTLPHKAAYVAGNRVLLVQMLANLLENASNHCQEGKSISLSYDIKNGMVRLVVADNGLGIPAHEREHVFEKMVRLDRSRSVPGAGLGLSMVRAIVRLHGGSIRLLDNAPGLRCEVWLPSAAGLTS
ncbi:sensor histidine kinase [Acetobacter vaccinii]|uniref:histidine kinase n=1 Tax=Acetobacter vaccinii TaxID=2592655 RepID=A0A5C1YS59_9PROT|nr:HAMP domain-containing sensor histidine kinase [Acetobacter vaccinii]QEO17797.1 HAMP domain-containing histidine kinase [Acetobacter vaccinii]